MTPEQAVLLLCDEYDAPFKDSSGNVKITIQYRIDWIRKNIAPEKIEHFVKKLMLNVQSQYLKAGRLPGLDVFESMIKPSTEELETEAAQMFDKLMNNVNIYRDFVTDNPRLMSGVIRLGGWKEICHSSRDSHTFMRDRFIREYVNCEPSMIPLEPSRGIGTSGKEVFIGKDRSAVRIENTLNQKRLNSVMSNLIDNVNGIEKPLCDFDIDQESPEKDIDEQVERAFGKIKTH